MKNKELFKLKNKLIILEQALISISGLEAADAKYQDKGHYWSNLDKEELIETIVNDTIIARKALKRIKKMGES